MTRSASTLRRSLVLLACPLALACFFSPSHAQPESPPPALALSGQIDAARLLDLAAQRLSLNIEFDSAAIKSIGQVTLRIHSELSDNDLWQLTNRVLVSRGYVTVRVPGRLTYAVMKLADAPNAGALIDIPDTDPQPGYRTTLIHTKHRNAKDLADAATKLLSKPGGVAIVIKEDAQEGVISISDLSQRVQQASELIHRLDTSSTAGRSVIEEIPIRNYTSQQMASLALELNSKREIVAGEKVAGEVISSPNGESVLIICTPERQTYWRDLIASLDKDLHIDSASYFSKGTPVQDLAKIIEQAVPDPDHHMKLTIDVHTGSIFVTGSFTQHDQIRAIINQLDAAAGSHRPVRWFLIRNRPAKELQSILEQLIQKGLVGETPSVAPATMAIQSGGRWPPTSPGFSRHERDAKATTDSANLSTTLDRRDTRGNPAQDQPDPDLLLSVDEGTNTLIAMGDPRLLSQAESLLQTLDIRQPQVMLEVLIVSLSESQTMDLGLELERLTGGETRTRISSLFGLSSRDSAGNVNSGSGLGLTGVVLNPGDFSVVFRALQTLNKGRSLSMPRLLVTNNQQATLDSVLEQPFASTNASNTVTTTSFGGTKPAGTQLTLKPQIAGGGEGDHLLLDYSVSLSAFVGAAANSSLPPPRQENKLQSVASLPDGHTVVVGGIELTTDGKATNQIPGLGAIPVLGEAFKSRSNNVSRSRFYVFIRGNILRSRGYEDLKYISEVTTTQVEINDGWPVVEPRVIR